MYSEHRSSSAAFASLKPKPEMLFFGLAGKTRKHNNALLHFKQGST